MEIIIQEKQYYNRSFCRCIEKGDILKLIKKDIYSKSIQFFHSENEQKSKIQRKVIIYMKYCLIK